MEDVKRGPPVCDSYLVQLVHCAVVANMKTGSRNWKIEIGRS